MSKRVKAIDIVVNLWTEEAMKYRSKLIKAFLLIKLVFLKKHI